MTSQIATSRRNARRLARWAAPAALLLMVPAVGHAASGGLSLADPTEGVATVATFDYQTDVDTRAFVKYRPSGGAACAPTAATDTGEGISDSWYISGAGKRQRTFTPPRAGTYQVCIWFSPSAYDFPTYATTQQLTVRSVRGSLSIGVPMGIVEGGSGQLSFSGQTESPATVYATIRPAGGAPCAVSRDADTGEGVIDTDVSGAFNVSTNPRQFPAGGTFQLCAWLATDSNDTTPIAATTNTLVVRSLPKATTTRVSASPGSTRRSRAIRVSAFVSSTGGSPAGRCAFDRLVRKRWQPYTTVSFAAGQACKARVYAGQLGRVAFRVRYLPAPGRAFKASTGFSGPVYVRR